MSKPSARTKVPPDFVTRKQQAKAMAQVKAQEIGENVADRIRDAVRQEVGKQLGPIVSTMTDLIDRVLDLEQHQAKTSAPDATPLSAQRESATVPTSEDQTPDESNSPSGQPGEETPEVPVDDQVVPEPRVLRFDAPGTDENRDHGLR